MIHLCKILQGLLTPIHKASESFKNNEGSVEIMSNHEHKHINRLIHEKSPYLLQHAHNPVDWFPWGAESFEKAKRENKPVFVSIGYS